MSLYQPPAHCCSRSIVLRAEEVLENRRSELSAGLTHVSATAVYGAACSTKGHLLNCRVSRRSMELPV